MRVIRILVRSWMWSLLLAGFLLSSYSSSGDSTDRVFAENPLLSFPDTNAIKHTLSTISSWDTDLSDSTVIKLHNILEQSRVAGYLPGITESLINLGIHYNQKGMYAEALQVLQEAVRYTLQSGQYNTTLPRVYNTLGNIHLALGAYELAATFYEQAARLAEQYRQKKVIGSIYNNFAGVLSRMKQYEKALYYLDQSERVARAQGNNRLLANVISNKGTVYMHQQEWAKSLFYFEHLLSFSKKHGLNHTTYLALCNIGNIFLQQDMPRRAITYLREANMLTHSNTNPVHTTILYITLGKTYQRLGDTRHAIQYLEKAIVDARKAGIDDERAEAHKSLAAVYAATGNYKDAFIHKELYEELRDKIENRDIFNNINQMETRYRTAQKDKELIQKQLLIQQQQLRLEHKNLLIYGSMAGILLLTIVLASIYRSHRHKQHLQTNQIKLLQHEQDLSLREKEITELKAVMRGEEKERTRIARDLHDGVVSSLSATRLNLSTLAHRIQPGPFETEFNETIQQLSDSIQELRITAQNLTSEILLQNGLKEAVYSFCKKMETASGLEIDFHIYGQIPDIDSEFELSLYRMTQELIHNAIKHAQASLLTVQFSCRENWLGITVEDNGTGMPAKPNYGTGITNIRSRVKAVNGQMNITTDNSGTTVYLEFDLQQTEKTIRHADQTSHM